MDLSAESANWILPSYPTTVASTMPNYEDAPPFRVHQEGVKNYMKNRGTLNIGDWAVEGRRASRMGSMTQNEPTNTTILTQPKVVGPDALRNYSRSRSSTPNLIHGTLQPPDSHHHHLRVRREGQANYERNHDSQLKSLLHNYGKLPRSSRPMPHAQGEVSDV
jgi:hypothetical protein